MCSLSQAFEGAVRLSSSDGSYPARTESNVLSFVLSIPHSPICPRSCGFPSQGLLALLYQICENDVPSLPANYSADLCALSRMLWERDPARRPSAGDILRLPVVVDHIRLLSNSISVARSRGSRQGSILDVATGSAIAGGSARRRRSSGNAVPRSSRSDRTEAPAAVASPSPLTRTPAPPPPAQEQEQAAAPRLTPRERLRLRKLQASDARARELSEVREGGKWSRCWLGSAG